MCSWSQRAWLCPNLHKEIHMISIIIIIMLASARLAAYSSQAECARATQDTVSQQHGGSAVCHVAAKSYFIIRNWFFFASLDAPWQLWVYSTLVYSYPEKFLDKYFFFFQNVCCFFGPPRMLGEIMASLQHHTAVFLLCSLFVDFNETGYRCSSYRHPAMDSRLCGRMDTTGISLFLGFLQEAILAFLFKNTPDSFRNTK